MFDKFGISNASIAVFLMAALFAHTNAQPQEVATSDKVIKEKPIIIQTVAQTYDQPTLGEYQICHENLDKCLAVCVTANNRTACEKECPTCPILISQDVVVQGINDTDYRIPPVTGTGNTTTIIRLTNEIHNIIENNMGNVTALNENNIHLHQNISTSGGKFGLGYNQNGSCCIVVRSSKNCDRRQFSTASRCHRKRHRVCGERCKSRVMYAKRVTKCTEPTGDEMSTCNQTISYVPYRKATHSRRRSSHCQYTNRWPFVSCSGGRRQRSMAHCQRCYELPYIYVVQQRIPQRCRSCFGGAGYYGGYGGYGGAHMEVPCYVTNTCYPIFSYYPPPMYPIGGGIGGAGGFGGAGGGGDDFDIEDEEFLTGDGWTVESTKCRRANGTIDNNCHQEEDGSGDGNPIIISDKGKKPVTEGPLDIQPEAEDETYDENNYDDDDYDDDNNEDDDVNFSEKVRRRRKSNVFQFQRSIYSRRHRENKETL